MKKVFILLIGAAAILSCRQQTPQAGYPIGQVPFTRVKVSDQFWGERLRASREVTIPLAFSKCEETGRYENFVRATHPDSTYRVTGYSFDDTDVYKTIEGASYLLQTYPDAKLEAYIDSVLVLVAAAQEPDGYLNTARQMNPWHPHAWMGAERWSQVEELSHEFYNLGHMVEGAVAHYQATGKRNFLDIAIRYADCVCAAIGDAEGQVARVPGHQIAEMALAKLSLVTGEKKYLDQARYFLDKRGRTAHRNPYNQSHKPVLEQDEAVGHAVRAEYMYSGMADVAALTGEQAYIDAIDRIWENIVSKKLYLTGGVGSRYSGESFGDNYELPNLTSYCETCAAIGNVYTNYRMFLLHGDAKYMDVLERTLYNGVISGVSLDGGAFFYPNPLESDGRHHREPWFGCACCPSNICRFIPSVPGYVYAAGDKDLYVNLYMANTMTHRLGGGEVTLSQQTSYPWEGSVRVRIDANKAGTFTLRLRIPGWVRGEVVPSDLYAFADDRGSGYGVSLNGEALSGELQNGYFCITRKWKAGDEVELNFDMEPRMVRANEAVEADRGRLAVECGPLVYCAEWPDNETDVLEASVSVQDELTSEFRSDLLGGVRVIRDGELTLIPYYAWNHRGQGHMEVWMRERQ
ncbi:MAG: glycoside hydrolase family 127 protein [Bacteroidales bacterium]|nr:glycoside hydrolase family 127 protein [Bacteroidales bacterium]